jgi:hypothetical protein
MAIWHCRVQVCPDAAQSRPVAGNSGSSAGGRPLQRGVIRREVVPQGPDTYKKEVMWEEVVVSLPVHSVHGGYI